MSRRRPREYGVSLPLRSLCYPMIDRPIHASWLGDLDSNQGCAGQSREFYR